MSKQQKKDAQEIDEHDLPTEPMPFSAILPGAQQMTPADALTPSAVPYGQPSPQQQALVLPQPSWEEPQGDKIYPPQPVQPPAGRRGKKKRWPSAPAPAQSQPAYPVYPAYPAYPVYPAQPVYPKQSARGAVPRHSPVPALVKLFFRLVQLLLLARILLALAQAIGLWTSNASWVSIVYALSNAFIGPVATLWQQVLHNPFSVGPEIYALLGIVLYGLLARILVGILRIFLR